MSKAGGAYFQYSKSHQNICFPPVRQVPEHTTIITTATPSMVQTLERWSRSRSIKIIKTKCRMVMLETIFLGMIFIFCSSLSVKRSARSPKQKNIKEQWSNLVTKLRYLAILWNKKKLMTYGINWYHIGISSDIQKKNRPYIQTMNPSLAST